MSKNIFALERKKLGLTQEQLAKKLNTSRSNVANWENGQNMPSIELLFKCSDIFQCDVMYLAGYQKSRTKQDDGFIPTYDGNENTEKKITEEEKFNLFCKVLKEEGFLDENEELTEESFNELLEFAKANKKYIMKKH